MFNTGLEQLNSAERRYVRNSIKRGERVDDPRLAAALVRYCEHFAANWLKVQLATATLAAAAGIIGLVVYNALIDAPLDLALMIGAIMGLFIGFVFIAGPKQRRRCQEAIERHS